MKCPVCEKELTLALQPEYSSSGVWCFECGVNFSNPKDSFLHIPPLLFEMVERWNMLWETLCDGRKTINNKNLWIRVLTDMGEELQKEISAYEKCDFDPYFLFVDELNG